LSNKVTEGRKIRREFYSAVYHIVNRGNKRKYLFKKDEDKEMLLKIINETKEESDFKLLAYVIMDNHYHIIIKNKSLDQLLLEACKTKENYYLNRLSEQKTLK